MPFVKLGSASHVAGATLQPIPLAALPVRGPGGIAYLKRIVVDVNMSLTQGNGGQATSPLQLHNIIAALTVHDGREPWGPDRLTGEILAENDYFVSAEPIPFSDDIAGDSNIANNAGAVTRRWQAVYDYSAFGEDGTEFTPPCAALRNGQIVTATSATPTNTTITSITYTFYADVYFEDEVKAVPRIQTRAQLFPSTDFQLGCSGALLGLFFRSSSAIVAGDIAGLTMLADGLPIHQDIEIAALRPRIYNVDPEVTGQRVQRHFMDVVGGSNPLAEPIFPLRERRKPITVGKSPIARVFEIHIRGALTVANYTYVYTYARELSPSEAVQQIAGCGCDMGKVHAAIMQRPGETVKAKTSSKMPLRDTQMMGFLPLKLVDPELAKSSGLSG